MDKKVGDKYFIYLSDKKNGCWYYLKITTVSTDQTVYRYDSIQTNDPETIENRWFTEGSEMDTLAIKCENLNVALKLKALHGI